MKALLTLLLLFGLSFSMMAQVPEMRTRKLTSMTNQEVEDYLARNDIVIIPCGPIEMHGLMPLEAEYVMPLGWAIKMAEKADALVLPHFVFLYPGGTTIGKGTFYMSHLESAQLLMNICKQLIRMGFKRFFFVTGHGPAPVTINPIIRELYDEYGIPAISTSAIQSDASAKVTGTEDRSKTLFGCYKIAGQLEDIPLGVVVPREVITPEGYQAETSSGSMGNRMGNIYTDPSQHSWSPDQPLTEELREQYAEEGVAYIEMVAAEMDFGPTLQEMNHQIAKYNDYLIPKYGDLLDFKKYKAE